MFHFGSQIRALALGGFVCSLAACGGGSGHLAPPVAGKADIVHLPMPKSISPGTIKAPPMAITGPRSAQTMNARSPKSTIGAAQWVQLVGGASQISAAGDGTFWALSPDGPNGGLNSPDKYIWHNLNGTWINVGGAAAHISAATDGSLWVVNSLGGIYHNVYGVWFALSGGAKDISVAPDGSIFVLGNSPGDAAIYHFNGVWTQFAGAGTTIAANPDLGTHGLYGPGGFWVTNSFGEIYNYTPGVGYTKLSGKAAQIAPTRNGGIFVLGFPLNSAGNPLYYNDLDTGTWTQIPGGAINLATDSANLFAIGGGGGIYETPIVSGGSAASPPPSSIGAAPAVGFLAQTSSGSFAGVLNNTTSSATLVAISDPVVGVTYHSGLFPTGHIALNLGTTSLGIARETQSVSTPGMFEHTVDAVLPDAEAIVSHLRPATTSGGGPRHIATTRRAKSLPNTLGATNSFWVQKSAIGSNTGVNIQVPATLTAVANNGYVWTANTLTLDQPTLTALTRDLDNAYMSDTAHYGQPSFNASATGFTSGAYTSCDSSGATLATNVDSFVLPPDSKVNMLVLDTSSLGSGVGGYFYSIDYFYQSALNCLVPSLFTADTLPRSNEAPMIYVAWNSAAATSNLAYLTDEDLVRGSAHELQHLINFVNHGILNNGKSEQSWINEGMSMLSQDFAVNLLWNKPHDVEDAFFYANQYLQAPQNYILTAFAGKSGTSYRYNCGACYGQEYLFQRYLYDRFGGDTYLRAMLGSTTAGFANLQQATGVAPQQLVADFAMALAASGSGAAADPRYGFSSLTLGSNYMSQLNRSTFLSTPGFVSLAPTSTVGQGTFSFYNVGPTANGQIFSAKDLLSPTLSLKVGVVQR